MILLLLILFLLCPSLVHAEYIDRVDCDDIAVADRVANTTSCKQTTTTGGRTAGHIYNWTGAAWSDMDTGGSGTGSQHRVNGTDVTTNDPINFRTTASVQATNPSAGNIDFNSVLQSGSGLQTTSGLSLRRDCNDQEVPKWDAGGSSWTCSVDNTGGTPTWNSIADPAGNLALAMAARTTAFTWNDATGASNLFSLTDTVSNTGTGYLARFFTASGSTVKPFMATAGGTANGVEMTTAGVLQPIGTGVIAAAFSGLTGTATNGQLPTTLSSKTLDNTNTITLKDTLFTLQDDGDTTKQGRFQLSGLSAAVTRAWTMPNADTRMMSDNDFSGTFTGLLRRTGSGAYTAIKDNLTAVGAPTFSNDTNDGYSVSSIWINTSASPRAVYMATDVTAGAAVWLNLGTATEADTLATVCARGCTYTAETFNTGLIIQNTGGTVKVSRFVDSVLGPRDQCSPECDVTTFIPTNKVWNVYDQEGAANIFTVDPDAASKNAMYQFGANYKPIASLGVPLTERGATTIALESIVSNQPGAYYATVTDADTDAVDFEFPITKRMEGATTATVRLIGVSKNAAPSGNIVFTCAMKAYRPGTDTYTAHVTTGEQTVTLTPATQNRPVAVTSPAITINGNIADGGTMVGSCEVDATGTTSAQLTDFRLLARGTIQILVNSISD